MYFVYFRGRDSKVKKRGMFLQMCHLFSDKWTAFLTFYFYNVRSEGRVTGFFLNRPEKLRPTGTCCLRIWVQSIHTRPLEMFHLKWVRIQFFLAFFLRRTRNITLSLSLWWCYLIRKKNLKGNCKKVHCQLHNCLNKYYDVELHCVHALNIH